VTTRIRGIKSFVSFHAINGANVLLLATTVSLIIACGGSGKPFRGESEGFEWHGSAARIWNQAVLFSIRNDLARPPVHARNLFHTSAAMYDAWAAYADTERPYLLGNQLGDYECPLESFSWSGDINTERSVAISHAVHRLILHRFAFSRGYFEIRDHIDEIMEEHGLDVTFDSTDYSTGSAAALGNYIANCYIEYGLQDGAHEVGGYVNTYYEPVNPPIAPAVSGNPDIIYLDRWQPLELDTFIDQSGNPGVGTQPHLAPEWGNVRPFALTQADLKVYERDGHEYRVYLDPGMPPTIHGTLSEEYKWSFALVAIWSSHLDASDGVMWDISPASIGNTDLFSYPLTFEEHRQFYNLYEGNTVSPGHPFNPVTGAPYEPQIVPRGDYTRALTEFWADGPDSYTPPGHWFSILYTVVDHPDFVRRYGGAGPELDPLEWEVKAFFVLSGAMHDSAIAAWGTKGWYDYVRPISAIRAMADRGQSSDPMLPSYHVDGLPLHEGFIELVQPGDPLAGDAGEHVGKIKLYAWRGHPYVEDPEVDVAGVGWILAENWWPHQRPTFVTPPFAGYPSGHSTYSAAAASVLTSITGSPYFPGGMSDFRIPAGELLDFEYGPSSDVILQWATYQDASDQTSLSRIWGGIHPPIDDIPGRFMGRAVAARAVALAEDYFAGY
jgi:hypothetical protein